MIKVTHVNTLASGGAAKACLRLHQNLQGKVASKVLCLKERPKKNDNSTPIDNTFIFSQNWHNPYLIQNRIKAEWHRRKSQTQLPTQPQYEPFSLPNIPFDLENDPHIRNSDIIHLHWVSGFVNIFRFFKNLKKPIVWTLHDMAAFTAGCHYSFDCQNFIDNCKPCFQLKNKENNQLTSKILRRKKDVFAKQSQVHIVALNQWMRNLVQKSAVMNTLPTYVIPNALAKNSFQHIEKSAARKQLNLPENIKILTFVAESVNTYRKGIHLLLPALEEIAKSKSVMTYAIGRVDAANLNSKHIHCVGEVQSEAQLNLWYSASDAFLLPSLRDNLPNTVMESLACGTPVIAFAQGGVSEMIQEGFNGMLCPELTIESLKKTLYKFLELPSYFFKGAEINKKSWQDYHPEKQTQNYLKLYESLISTAWLTYSHT